jgi:hypothetical protein
VPKAADIVGPPAVRRILNLCLFLHCAGLPLIVIEHEKGGRPHDWYDPQRSAFAKCRILFLIGREARLS